MSCVISVEYRCEERKVRVSPLKGSARLSRTGWFSGRWMEESVEPERTLFGSFTSTYFPSGCFMHRSIIAFMMPHPLASDTFSWLAKSKGRYEAVLRIT